MRTAIRPNPGTSASPAAATPATASCVPKLAARSAPREVSHAELTAMPR
ncbi:Uncharacterised protein [Mycobacteroides abscessus subsp. abscessus]|nr:Uncharacterised protein [Mycobacteroides abscessus subsp. abscessus]